MQNWTCSVDNHVCKIWLVVSTHLKNTSQLGLLFAMYGKIEDAPNHQPEIVGVRVLNEIHPHTDQVPQLTLLMGDPRQTIRRFEKTKNARCARTAWVEGKFMTVW